MVKLLPVAALLLLTSAAWAQETPKKWKDTAEFSYVKTSGNTKTSTISGKNLFNYDWEKAALELTAGGLGTKSDGHAMAEQYNAAEKISWKLSGKNYTFQKVAWDKNRFAGIKDRWDAGLGLGRHVLDSADDQLFAEAGLGLVWEDRYQTKNQDYGTYRGYAKYIRTLSPSANASQDLEFLGNLRDPDGYRMKAETALITSISTHFSLKASYLWKNNNRPGNGFKKTDTLTAMTIIVNY